MTGIFIAVEGPNGVGKSTSARLLATRLAIHGHSVHLTTEPSRTRLGALIRQTEAELTGRTQGVSTRGLTESARPGLTWCDAVGPSS